MLGAVPTRSIFLKLCISYHYPEQLGVGSSNPKNAQRDQPKIEGLVHVSDIFPLPQAAAVNTGEIQIASSKLNLVDRLALLCTSRSFAWISWID